MTAWKRTADLVTGDTVARSLPTGELWSGFVLVDDVPAAAPVQHIVSCTVRNVDGDWQHLAMCGEPVGSYAAATAAGMVAGNYLTPTNADRYADCEPCVTRFIKLGERP